MKKEDKISLKGSHDAPNSLNKAKRLYSFLK